MGLGRFGVECPERNSESFHRVLTQQQSRTGVLHLLRQELDSKAIRALLLSIERFIMSITSQKKNLNHCLLVKIAADSELMSVAVGYVIKQPLQCSMVCSFPKPLGWKRKVKKPLRRTACLHLMNRAAIFELDN